MTKKEGRGIQSVEIGGRMLSALVNAKEPMMLRDLAGVSDLAAAQAHAYVSSFKRMNLIDQDPGSSRYQLGPLAIRLGMARIRSYWPLTQAHQATKDLEKVVGLRVALIVWGQGLPAAVAVQAGRYPLNVNLQPGTMFPILGTAAGHIFAAFSATPEVKTRIQEEFSARFEGQKPSGLGQAEFWAGIEIVREQGFAVTNGEPVPHLDAIAAPVFDLDGRLLAAITLVGEKTQFDAGPREKVLDALLSATRPIGRGK